MTIVSRFLKVSLGIASVLCLFGCVSRRDLNYFDINQNSTENIGKNSRVFPLRDIIVSSTGDIDRKIIFRKDDFSIIKDSNNLWSNTPDEMLKRYLLLNLPKTDAPANSDYGRYIIINILKFEVDIDKDAVVLCAEIKYFDKKNNIVLSRVFYDTEKIGRRSKMSGITVAECMSIIAERLKNAIQDDLDSVPQS